MDVLLHSVHTCLCVSLLTFLAQAFPEVQHPHELAHISPEVQKSYAHAAQSFSEVRYNADGQAQSDQRLLLILLDGFRWDYLEKSGTSLPGFRKVIERGAKPEYLIPDFPTSSYPNYYSIMTGLRTESHGMTGNYMYDVDRRESFLIGQNPEQYNAHWWDGGDPLWTTAVRQNKTVYMYHWPGCEVEIRGLVPTFCRKYTSIPSMDDFRSAITTSLAQLQYKEADVAAIFFELTDSLGHNFGPLSDEVIQLISDLDPIIEYLADSLATYALSDVNLMLISDHGMTEINRHRVIKLNDILHHGEFEHILNTGATTNIYPKPGMEEKIYSKLENFHPNLTVYRKRDLPERWRYKHGKYVAPLTAVADLGWFITHPHNQDFPKRRKDGMPKMGGHGYDNKYKDMMGFFVGMGPGFRKNVTSEPIHVVDLYQMMCTFLGIQASPNSGSLERVASIVTFEVSLTSAAMTTHLHLRILLIPVLTIAMMLTL